MKFINTNIGLIFVLTILICAAGIEQMEFEEFTEQVGDKSAAFFMAEFTNNQEQQNDKPSDDTDEE